MLYQVLFVVAFVALWTLLGFFLWALARVVRTVDRGDPDAPRDYGL